ncbi:WD repeat-containing protein 47-like [Watersipora subatra]|uniref:WD repeat-containing protein 47-like n=1 Tax=Watersipora subatra TaxID=2589382 RepID=UPI00355B5C72
MTLSHTVELGDKDIIKMIEEYLANRQFDIALMCLERESGIINGVFSEDGLFLRQLILDGHWDDVLEFLLPLHGVEGFDKKRCLYLIYKHKFLELLCIKLDPGPLQNHDFTLDEVVSCLTELEHLCSDRKEYDNLCFLLTLPSISSDQAYKNWNPSSARINCFNELYPLVSRFIGLEKAAPSNSSAKHDRLVNLLAKGLLYEMCVELCTARACGTGDSVTVNHLLNGTPCSDADLSLVTWLQKVPSGTLAIPFEKKSLKLKTERLEKPTLEAVWSEQLLAAPIKPKQFPHTSIPARTKSSQIISQSMMAMYDGLSSNLFTPHGLRGSMSEPRRHPLVTSTHLSRSYAHTPANKFVLANSFSCDRRNNPMNQSVEQLFSKSALSSPRPPTLSFLATNKTSEILSPGFADLSPTFAPPGSTPQLHDAASPQLHDNTKPASNRQTLPSNRQSPNVKPEGISGAHKSVQQDDAQRRMGTPDTVRPSASAPPVSASQTLATSARYSSSDRICSIQKPDILQHDIKETVASVPGRGDMAGSIRASQDLYAQYQQQKKRIEEEMRLMEERDEKWRAIHSDTQRKIEDPVPQLDLDQSENDEAPAETCQQDAADDTFDELHSAVDPVGIKQFVAVETLEEQGPVRAIAFHPSGECYAVGSNTKVLRVCQYPDMSKVTTSYHLATKKPKVLAKKVKHHAGSIYCTA